MKLTDRERVTMLREACRTAKAYLTAKARDGIAPRYTVEPPDYVVRLLERALTSTAVSRARRVEHETPPLFPPKES